ncbi:hypothetical protein BDZ45DRAFT_744223 [Acephala macrosclerotiorum]|nr:hypothetical protein BDZ45DRAFT_744223 [Acephala macrosclerotiorum]
MAATAGNRRQSDPRVVTRDLADGGKLEYRLNVIQQPERARACGSGAKSSADRRPVDPPPVVELRIFSVNGTQKEDITFSYSANFFLFATLEVARPMAHGRVQQPPASQQVPVLTGMPVSGMAYLDRPTEAGYFIFPDLSVRHEGMYRLSFNLYEEMRGNESEGEAQSDKSRVINGPGVPGAPDSSFDWRMEVKSAEFTVYSAKKFPGLAESTALSRTVAEQGCRVRIRRDVRMRRREGKNGGDFDQVDEDGYERGRAEQQEFQRECSRSNSAGSDEGRAPYQNLEQGRQYQSQYPSYSPSPVTGHAPPPQGGHLGFIGQSAQYQGPPPAQFAQPQAPAPQSYQPPPIQNAYHTQGQPQYRPQPSQAPPPPNAYPYERQHPQSAYPSNPPREHRDFELDYRRASFAGYGPSQPAPYPSMDSNYPRPPYGYNQRANSPLPSLAPLKLPIEPKFEAASSPTAPLSAIKTNAQPLPSPSYPRTQAQEGPGSYSQYSAPLPAIDPVREPARNGKRPFDAVFNSVDSTKPLHNGMRPSSPHDANVDDEDDEDDLEAQRLLMSYKRADGSATSRQLPCLSG